MSQSLSPETVAIVKATEPALAQYGEAISLRMYERLFQDEAVRALFNQANQGKDGAQVKALAAAVLAYARNIDALETLGSMVERVAQKHVGFHVLPEHYPIVGAALLAAIADVLGKAATPAVIEAWRQAYWHLADIMQGREAAIRRSIESAPGGWSGWRDFVVVQKKQESTTITSFVLRPKDGGSVIRHLPGQYLTVHIPQPAGPPLTRNYSISSGPGDDSYRITIKREPGGTASNWMHDRVDVGDAISATPPAGDFCLSERPERPLVLLSAGVGLTPMVSMLEAIVGHWPGLQVDYVHGTASSGTHAMDQHVRDLARRYGGIDVHTFYSRPGAHDLVGTTHDVTGRITVDWLRDHTSLADADFYLCGPLPFLRFLISGLAGAGVGIQRLHYEFFGPAAEALAA
ncbi:NO-inducible flavohemoprotein [Lichenicola cladoniae]|uniref:nitric oxide dioxygenase n=1 Tax=Lichenicola cladoniae TaxID=1484109 RepID=A0A6M8HRK4_9PROT|nr:NO-inducible flavohemoprotein [Lichenicola cladoniae]NPD69159.1 NO-inducible flavohemoprotein [Acetobacteraceae bacterium]QKE90978.1 NO-inducible flavohemoprotein [Lichenicola cladoniae]